jgi:hypothetical protein
MIRTFFSMLASLLFFAVPAMAQTCGALPNTLTNGANADATQVMADLNALRTCIINLAAAGVLWTPVFNINNSPSGIAYTASGVYVQIGKMVLAEAVISITGKGTRGGPITIAGLPVLPNSLVGIVSVPYYGNFAGLTGALDGYVKTSEATAVLTVSGATTHGSVLDTNLNPSALG